MPQLIFVNHSVKDLTKSMAFFEHLGWSFNPQFTDENAACLVISDTIFAMLLTEPYFKTFTKKPISNAQTSTETILALSVESREEVDRLTNAAFEAGAKVSREKEDHGWMYAWGFEDLDGHLWEVIYMDQQAVADGTAGVQA